MYLLAGLKDQLENYLTADQIKDVERAYLFAKQAHEGQMRSSGEPYITHPVAVAHILSDINLDHQTIMAALMHDVIEDTGVSRDDLAGRFGEDVAELVEGVSKLTNIKFSTRAEAQAENFRKMMLAMVRDIRVIMIKLADRLHNMRTLGHLRPDKRRRIATETLEIYAPIANRLGIYSIREEMQVLGFSALYPMRHKILEASVKRARGNRVEIISTVQKAIQEQLDSTSVGNQVIGREKNLFSIYRKMRDKKMSFFEVMDIYAFRIITNDLDSCYRILGQMHMLYKPVHGRFKDYIAIPKANGYQSLHTTLKGPHGLHVEIQIRTEDMHKMAEHGVAAHWLYKSQDKSNPAEMKAREWMRSLIEFQETASDSSDFIENVKIDLFPDEVYVFSPDGEIISLPQGATPVDFAYFIHTDVGNSCIACKIDRNLAPLSTKLVNGQTVQIITAPGARPNPAWLSFVITGKARANIRHFLKNLRIDEAIKLGQRLLDKALKGERLSDFSDEQIQRVLKITKHKNINDLLTAIGLGSVASMIVAHHLHPEVKQMDDSADAKSIAIQGTEGMLVNFGKCCRPIPGDPIVGFVSTGKGIMVHRDHCQNIADLRGHEDKVIPMLWSDDVSGDFLVNVLIDARNERGVLAKITAKLADADINITNMEIDEHDGAHYRLHFLIAVKDRDHLAAIIKRLRLIPAIAKISRVNEK
ncbi:MAG: bifunctional GTP diphosphokinase/guanosine-3',5'-bis pyrophosphate 3'-pyrophosphohydrolase [Enterobacterales bacterium]|nr:bifunctional GTP diphosphokinase/guanosine-3',5'-bis pyrophosphate 3'-pyrophosphohydrolase [Enterobacterales bacterium]